MIKNIILSGGWGYGNLGDDAILLSSVRLLRDKFPNARINILTYCIRDSKKVLKDIGDLYFYESLDRKLFGYNYHPAPIGNSKIDDIKFAITKRISIKKKLKTQKLLAELYDNTEYCIEKCKFKIDEYCTLVKECDLYIMSGGGYILDWPDSVISKYIEIYLAKKRNIKCFITGITYGPFYNKKVSLLASRIIKLSDKIFVRDKFSLNDIISIGGNCIKEVIPDIALRDEVVVKSRKNKIILIPFNRNLEYNANEICDDISNICNKYQYSVAVVVSQLWYNPMNVANKLFYKLRSMECDVEMIVPKDFYTLQSVISESQLVLSQNLHGLILSHRSNTPLICLNTTRKFVSFMEMIGGTDFIIDPMKFTKGCISDMYERIFLNKLNKSKSFKKQIDAAFESFLQ